MNYLSRIADELLALKLDGLGFIPLNELLASEKA